MIVFSHFLLLLLSNCIFSAIANLAYENVANWHILRYVINMHSANQIKLELKLKL